MSCFLSIQSKAGVLRVLWYYDSLTEAKLQPSPSAMMTYCDSKTCIQTVGNPVWASKIPETCTALL